MLPGGALLTGGGVVIIARHAVRHEEALPDAKESAGDDAKELRDDQSVASLVPQLSGREEEVSRAGRHEEGVGEDVEDEELGGSHRGQRHHLLLPVRQILSLL